MSKSLKERHSRQRNDQLKQLLAEDFQSSAEAMPHLDIELRTGVTWTVYLAEVSMDQLRDAVRLLTPEEGKEELSTDQVIENMVDVVVLLSADENGEPMLSGADKVWLRRSTRPAILMELGTWLGELAMEAVGTADEEAAKN